MFDKQRHICADSKQKFCDTLELEMTIWLEKFAVFFGGFTLNLQWQFYATWGQYKLTLAHLGGW